MSEAAAVALNGSPLTVGADLTFRQGLVLQEGLNSFVLSAQDGAGNTASISFELTLDTIPPASVAADQLAVQITGEGQVEVSAPSGSAEPGVSLTVTNGRTGESVTSKVAADGSFSVSLQGQQGDLLSVILTDAAGSSSGPTVVAVPGISGPGLPPDPGTIAPPVDPTVAADIVASTSFLYQGSDPIQKGVESGAFDPERLIVLRGRVLDRDGGPLPGVTISAPHHPQWGSTLSRADGAFDFVANGGTVVLQYEKQGWLTAQRTLQTPWRDFVRVDDVALVRPTAEATVIQSGAPILQVARGPRVEDASGVRRSTLLFQEGTRAEMILADGQRRPLETLTVRNTEFTAGPNGLTAMPAPLPPTTGYTYAVELSADEAVAAGARQVEFDRPVIHYVENFLDFPVGGIVPSGFYDRFLAAWIPAPNGRIVRILSGHDGLADLDLNGSGLPAGEPALDALGITEAERRQLAMLYEPGQSLWRVPIPHFTPWDHNWPFGPPENAEAPPDPDDDRNEEESKDEEEDPCRQEGSIIECENQILGEAIPVAGTPFSLHYQSDRTPGWRDANRIEITLSPASVPASLRRIELVVDIAGRQFRQVFAPQPGLKTTFSWDQKDVYGRTLQGRNTATVRIGYVYKAVYYEPSTLFSASFGSLPSSTTALSDRDRSEVTLWREQRRLVGVWDARAQGLGGWSFSPHHAYDPVARLAWQGDGARRSADDLNARTLRKYFQRFDTQSVEKVTQGPDGSLYFIETKRVFFFVYYYLVRLEKDGLYDAVLLSTTLGPRGLGVGPDGSAYVATCGTWNGYPETRVQRITRNGFSWGSTVLLGADQIGCPEDVEVGPDGSLYVSDSGRQRIYRIWPDGGMTTMAGTDGPDGGDGGPALTARLAGPSALSLGSDGSLYFIERDQFQVRRIAPSGTITRVAGTGVRGLTPDGLPAVQANLETPVALAAAPDGSVLVVEATGHRVRRVSSSGILWTEAGSGIGNPVADGAPARAAKILSPNGVALLPDGSLYISNQQGVHKVEPPLPGFTRGHKLVVSTNGWEVYELDEHGRHLRTLDSLNSALLYEMVYDAAGRLARVRDGFGNLTRIERETGGRPIAIVAPHGQRTELTLDANGFLNAIENPAGETTSFTYTPSGLLTSATDPRGGVSQYGYSPQGLLLTAQDAAGGVKTLGRSETADGYEVAFETPMGRRMRFSSEALPGGRLQRTVTSSADLQRSIVEEANGTVVQSDPSGLVTTTVLGPDPRFGMQAPITASRQVRTPSGLTSSMTRTMAATLSAPADPLSLSTLREDVTLNGRNMTRLFNVAQRKLSLTSPAGRRSAIIYNAQGLATAFEIGGIETLRLSYDPLGRLVSLAQGTGDAQRSLGIAYDNAGQVSALLDPLSRSMLLERDAVGRIVRQSLPGNRTIEANYDEGGNLVSLTPSGRPEHQFDISAVGLLSKYIPPGGEAAATTFSYNLDRQLTGMARPEERPVEIGHDTAGRLSRIGLERGDLTVSYQPGTGHLASVTSPDGVTVGYTYDGHLPTRTTWSGPVAGTFEMTYDRNFQVTAWKFNGGAPIAFQHDLDGLITKVGALTLTRSSQNGLVTATALGRVSTSQSYNGFGEPGSMSARFGTAEILSVQYERDKLGRIKSQNGQSIHYGYDELGNLVRVEFPDGIVLEYVIDGHNRRVGKRVNGSLVRGFLYRDALTPVAELDGNGNLISQFVYGSLPRTPDYLIKGSTTYRIIADHLGSPRLVIDTATGATVQRMDYDAFGQVILDTHPGFQPFGFAGGLYDPQTGLVRFGARDYDPQTGRWTAKDPALFWSDSPNLYAYVSNDPVNLIDREGRIAVPVILGGLVITTAAVLAYEVWLTTPAGKEFLRDASRLPPLTGPAESRRYRDQPGAPERTCPPPTAIPGARPKTTPAPPLVPVPSQDDDRPTDDRIWENEQKKKWWNDLIEGIGDVLEWLG